MSANTAQLCFSHKEILFAFVIHITSVGTVLFRILPFHICPDKLFHQHLTVLSVNIAQLWFVHNAILSTFIKFFTAIGVNFLSFHP